MRCPTCSHENASGAKFCAECGTKLELRCPACGAPNGFSSKFCAECGARLSGSPSTTTLSREQVTASKEERRWVTVLFADLSGFTTMSERMDPEDVKALAHQCAEKMSEQVR